jgi:hypothetical protein
MHTLREAKISDLQIIYNFENVPLREDILNSEALPWDEFFAERSRGMDAGNEKYFLLENSGTPEGFLKLSFESDFWYVVTWGRWMKTLIYCTGLAAFDHLKLPRVVWTIREDNTRWLNVYRIYSFEYVGENSIFVTRKEPPYLTTIKMLYFTAKAETFLQNRQLFEKYSLPVEVRW